MAEGNKKEQKPVPPGWNDPPPISPSFKPARHKLNQRVAYPLSSSPSDKVKTAPLNMPPMTTPPTAPPPLSPGLPPLPPSKDDEPHLSELKNLVYTMAEHHGKERTSEICHRFDLMVNMWPEMDENTRKYASEAIKSLHQQKVEDAKVIHEKLVQECGPNVVHWILMLKILINNMSSAS